MMFESWGYHLKVKDLSAKTSWGDFSKQCLLDEVGRKKLIMGGDLAYV